MSSKQNKTAAAQAMKAQRVAIERRERRMRLAIWGTVGLLMAGLVTAAVVVLSDSAAQQAAIREAAAQPIPEIVEEPEQDAFHAENLPEPAPLPDTGTVLPPLGGEHDPAWLNCGVYTEPVRAALAIHSMEHGAVWVTYHPDLDAASVQTLTSKLSNRAYTILSPLPNLASPIVLTAWGLQLEVDEVSDERIDVFLTKYIQGPQTPELGAACSGGVGTPQ